MTESSWRLGNRGRSLYSAQVSVSYTHLDVYKRQMKELKPGNLEDVIAGISLYRPGPMDFITQYIRGKNNPGSITYDLSLIHI